MTIEKRPNGKYRVRIWSPFEYERVSVGTFSSYASARSAERKAGVELETRGFLEKPKDVNFSGLCDAFLDMSTQIRSTTRDWYRQALKPARRFFGEGHSVRRLTREEAHAYVAWLTNQGKASKTVNGYVKALGAVLEYGVESEYLSANPARRLRNLPENKRASDAIRVLTRDEHERLVEKAPEAYKVMFSIWPLVGLRRAEMQGLAWQDVDFERGTLLVQHQLREDGSLDKRLKTKKSTRRVSLPTHVVTELRMWKLACVPTPLDLLFPTPTGLPQSSKSQFYKVWHRTCDAAGLSGLDPHDMRHTFATWSLVAGETPMWVANQMGHEKPSMTLDTYSHLLPDEETTGVSRLQEWYESQAS